MAKKGKRAEPPAETIQSSNSKGVNTSNLTDLKVALDDQVRQFFSAHFVRSHRHEDVRLALGWSAALIGFASAAYGYSHEFEESKQLVGLGVAVYAVLHTILAAYVKYVEKNAVFVGKRRNFGARVTTEKLTVASVAHPLPSYHFPLSLIRPPKKGQEARTEPTYELRLSYVHSANNGKALLNKADRTINQSVGTWFDAQGTLNKKGLDESLQKLLDQVLSSSPAS